MKTNLLREILIPGTLLCLSSVAAHAAPVDCSTITTVADAVSANAVGGCQIGNLVFSNFSFNFQSGTSNQSATAPQLPPANDVALEISQDGVDYSLVADFSSSNPLAAVAATDSMAFVLQY
jgi:hypothetical protein